MLKKTPICFFEQDRLLNLQGLRQIDQVNPQLTILDNTYSHFQKVKPSIFPSLGDQSLVNSVYNKMVEMTSFHTKDKVNLRVSKSAYCGSRVSVDFTFPGSFQDQKLLSTDTYTQYELGLIKEYLDQF